MGAAAAREVSVTPARVNRTAFLHAVRIAETLSRDSKKPTKSLQISCENRTCRIRFDGWTLNDQRVSMDTTVAIDGPHDHFAGRVPLKYLSKFLADDEAPTICLSVSNSVLAITGEGTIKVFCHDQQVDEAQAIEGPMKLQGSFSIQREDLTRMIRAVSKSICKDTYPIRSILTGVRIEPVDFEKVNVVATDTHRLTLMELPVSDSNAVDATCIPAVLLRAMALDKSGDMFEVTLCEEYVSVRFCEINLTAERLPGDFPNWKRVLPEHFTVQATCDRLALLRAVKRIAPLSKVSCGKTRLEISEQRIEVSTTNTDVGEMSVSVDSAITRNTPSPTMPCDYTKKDGLAIGFNSRYLIDALAGLTGNVLHFQFNLATSPALVTDESGTTKTLIMPMALR